MISINSLKINESSNAIDVDVSTTSGNTITQVLLWDIKTFKDYSQAIDLSHLLDGTDETEVFSIPASELNLTNISGLFFIEFESDEIIVPDDCNQDSNTALGVVSNFIKYHECLLNRVLKIDIKDCNEIINNCDNCNKNILFLSTLINSLNSTIKFAFYEEAIRITEVLEDICDTCHTCPDYENIKLINGLGFGTFNNSIILI